MSVRRRAEGEEVDRRALEPEAFAVAQAFGDGDAPAAALPLGRLRQGRVDRAVLDLRANEADGEARHACQVLGREPTGGFDHSHTRSHRSNGHEVPGRTSAKSSNWG